ncbi:MAG: n-acetylglutamate synthase [Flavobacteriales bacterium]|nr:n-acetylglutamate synthase [Flavobacteriales bacterium]
MTDINYNGRKFRVLGNSENGEVSDDMVFEYFQEGKILTCRYFGDKILEGHILGLVQEDGTIQMTYHQINDQLNHRTGKGISKPIILEDGRIQLEEHWEWTNGDKTKGRSSLVEML